MNKIDAAIESSPFRKAHNEKTLFLWFKENDALILEALQAMKETCSKNGEFLTHQENTLKDCTYAKECIAEQPDTIQDDDCVKQTIQEPCVRDALEDLDMIKYHHNQLQEVAFNSLVEKIRTALLAKQPDMERLKRVEDAVKDIHEHSKNDRKGQSRTRHMIAINRISRHLLTDILAMMEGK